jgi:putative ABC transport system ATP-binding protein
MSLIEFEGVEKTYGRGDAAVRAVHDVSLSIEGGAFALVVGPSGAGKTTLLNLIGGMEQPSAGRVSFDGVDLGGLDERGLTRYRRREVGFVFQFYNLIASLTARENVELAGELCDDPLPAEEVLAQVGLERRMDSFPAQLSGGEQQRVAVARALVKRPRLVLADEPTGALDFQTGRAVLELLQRMCREAHRTLVLITHNLAFAPAADQVIHMANGTVERVEGNARPVSASTLVW